MGYTDKCYMLHYAVFIMFKGLTLSHKLFNSFKIPISILTSLIVGNQYVLHLFLIFIPVIRYIKVILHSYLVLKKMNERITDS